jgi:hypothetical protein
MSTARSEEREEQEESTELQSPQIAFATLLREWLTREEDLKNLNAAVKEHKARIKVLKALITERMKSANTGKLDIPARGSVLIQPLKPKKASLSKKYLLSALTEYFKGDSEMASMCVHFLELHRPTQGGGEKLVFDPVAGGSVATRSVAGGSVAGGS